MIRFYGKDHRCPLHEREAFIDSSRKLRTGPTVYLQTCNRVELYCGDGEAPRELAQHLFRVTAGLESRMLGERHVQGQVKRAYAQACTQGTVSPGLHRLFQRALRAGKRVRAETGIAVGAVTHSRCALEVLRREEIDIARARVLVCGINQTLCRIIDLLRQNGCCDVCVTNRTPGKAAALAAQFGCSTAAFERRTDAARACNVLISATSSPRTLFGPDDFAGWQGLVIDLAVPRDIDPRSGMLGGVRLLNVCDVEELIDQNIAGRTREIERAERIIAEELERVYAPDVVECALC